MEKNEKILLKRDRTFQKWKKNPEYIERQEITIDVGEHNDEDNVSGLNYFIASNDHNEYYGFVYLEVNLDDLKEIKDNLEVFILKEEKKNDDEVLKLNTKRDQLREGYVPKLLEGE